MPIQQSHISLSRQQSSGGGHQNGNESINGSINGGGGRGGRVRTDSSCLDSAFSVDEAANYFKNIDSKKLFKPRPSCVFAEKDLMVKEAHPVLRRSRGFSMRGSSIEDDEDEFGGSLMGYNVANGGVFASDEQESVLGKVHLEMCKYYEVGRFSEPESDVFDEEAAFFHLLQAANLGIGDALTNVAKIYLQMPHDILSNYKVEVISELNVV